MNTTAFHKAFDNEMEGIVEQTREALLESSGSCTREEIVTQIMMDNLFPHPCDPESGEAWPSGLTTEQKKFLVGVASHMGPDFAQALYHASVFITKVA
jgi:hypothetical protein